MKKACGECFFLDVGQGTANVILLEGGRALVIDTGPARRGIVKRLLVDYGVREIECVVLSHNDRDHIAGFDLAALHGVPRANGRLDVARLLI